MFMWSNMCLVELVRGPVGGEELGPLWAMTATGAGLSLVLNIVVASMYPFLVVVLQPWVSLNLQRTLQWDSVVGENYNKKKKIFKAFSTFSSSSSFLGATTRLLLRFPDQRRCKEKRVPLAQIRGLPFCLFSLVDVDGITTKVVCWLLSGFRVPGRISKSCYCNITVNLASLNCLCNSIFYNKFENVLDLGWGVLLPIWKLLLLLSVNLWSEIRLVTNMTAQLSPSSSIDDATNTSGSSSSIGYIEHTVSKLDTLAGVVIKYGVKVMNSLTRFF